MAHSFRSLIAAVAGLAGTVAPASAQIFTVIGNNVEMYLDASCPSQISCGLAFPKNTTGKIIKINYISCQIRVIYGGQILYSAIGPSASSANIQLIKRTFFDTSRSVSSGTTSITYLSATPGLLLGVDRYLAVTVETTAGFADMTCAAAGTLAN
jgi:hypothetical protein